MTMALSKHAEIPAAKETFDTHQQVAKLNIKNVINEYLISSHEYLLMYCIKSLSTNRRGTKAINISGENPHVGHAKLNNKPDNTDRIKFLPLFLFFLLIKSLFI
jgi:hypothetical protein